MTVLQDPGYQILRFPSWIRFIREQASTRMAEGYEHDDEPDFPDLDEWLCEYVDGTIDPVVREALEEYMEINPALACHVDRLRQTRSLLCRYGCRYRAPQSLQPRLRRRLASEYVRETQPLLASMNFPLMAIASLCSALAVLLIISSTKPAVAPPSYNTQQGAIMPSDEQTHLRATPFSRLSTSRYYAYFAQPGNVIALPARSQSSVSALIPTNKLNASDSVGKIADGHFALPTP